MFSRRGESEGSAGQVDGRRDSRPNRERFEAVALPHLDAVHRLARALGSTSTEADDLVQETFVRAFQAFGRFELREYGAKPWLLRILCNTFYTFRGRQRREPALLDDLEPGLVAQDPGVSDGESVTAESVNWDHFDEEIKSAVEQLQPEYRIVLLLWAIEGLSYKEIAEVCDCALGTVMSRLFRARRLLGHRLREYARKNKWSTKRID